MLPEEIEILGNFPTTLTTSLPLPGIFKKNRDEWKFAGNLQVASHNFPDCDPSSIWPLLIDGLIEYKRILRAALHLEAGPISLEADCTKFQPFLGWRPASTTHYNKIITGANFPICKGPRAKKPSRFNKFSNREERMKSRWTIRAVQIST